MEFKDKGFSNIKMPKISSTNSWYAFNENSNKFPEEVFVHEFLHSLEKNSKKYGFKVPELHSYTQNGYEKQSSVGLYSWYLDYMNSNIGNEKIGLNEKIYSLKPVNNNNFDNSKKVDEFIEINNVVERLAIVIKTMI